MEPLADLDSGICRIDLKIRKFILSPSALEESARKFPRFTCWLSKESRKGVKLRTVHEMNSKETTLAYAARESELQGLGKQFRNLVVILFAP